MPFSHIQLGRKVFPHLSFPKRCTGTVRGMHDATWKSSETKGEDLTTVSHRKRYSTWHNAK